MATAETLDARVIDDLIARAAGFKNIDPVDGPFKWVDAGRGAAALVDAKGTMRLLVNREWGEQHFGPIDITPEKEM